MSVIYDSGFRLRSSSRSVKIRCEALVSAPSSEKHSLSKIVTPSLRRTILQRHAVD